MVGNATPEWIQPNKLNNLIAAMRLLGDDKFASTCLFLSSIERFARFRSNEFCAPTNGQIALVTHDPIFHMQFPRQLDTLIPVSVGHDICIIMEGLRHNGKRRQIAAPETIFITCLESSNWSISIIYTSSDFESDSCLFITGLSHVLIGSQTFNSTLTHTRLLSNGQ